MHIVWIQFVTKLLIMTIAITTLKYELNNREVNVARAHTQSSFYLCSLSFILQFDPKSLSSPVSQHPFPEWRGKPLKMSVNKTNNQKDNRRCYFHLVKSSDGISSIQLHGFRWMMCNHMRPKIQKEMHCEFEVNLEVI